MRYNEHVELEAYTLSTGTLDIGGVLVEMHEIGEIVFVPPF